MTDCLAAWLPGYQGCLRCCDGTVAVIVSVVTSEDVMIDAHRFPSWGSE